jgi:Uma2 family endonuclease
MATLAQVDLFQEGALIGLPMPLTLRPQIPLSDDDLIAISHKNRPYRIERNAHGELEIMSPVGMQSGHWEAYIVAQLCQWAEENGGIAFSSDAGFTLRDTSVRSPDAAWVSDAHWNALSADEQRRFGATCPEFLIELLSESDSRPKLEAKMEQWIANGAQVAWLVDPYSATVSIYRPDAELEVIDRPDIVEADGPVAGFRLATGKLWSDR